MSDPLILHLLHYLGGGVCHQLPERSLHIGDTPLPLCARCTGTYVGAVVGLSAVAAFRRIGASRFPRWPTLLLLGFFFLVWGTDGLNSYLTFFPGFPHAYEPNNTLRLVTGTLEGLALSLLIWPVVAYTLWPKPQEEPILNLRRTVASALVALALIALIAADVPGMVYVAGALSMIGLLALFTLLNSLLVAVLLHREGKIGTRRQAAALFLASFLLGLGELVLLSALRHWLLGF